MFYKKNLAIAIRALVYDVVEIFSVYDLLGNQPTFPTFKMFANPQKFQKLRKSPQIEKPEKV
jgi:hypothetical protein